MAKLTGERPVREVTPDSVLALHDAGYREMNKKLGDGIVVDLGAGEGFETVKLISEKRTVIGIDYDLGALKACRLNIASKNFYPLNMDATKLGVKDRSVDFVCCSHIIEHFDNPAFHVREVARILKEKGSAFFITPNKPQDFENPFHLRLFDKEDLYSLLLSYFNKVEIFGLDAKESVKNEIKARREKASKVYALDIFDLRHKMPRNMWIFFYSRLLPLGQKIIYKNSMEGKTGITEDDFFLSEKIDDTTLVLFAEVSLPKN